MTLDFWQIAMRPGKPLLFGQLGATPVLGLPGNPVSAMVCAILFLVPALARLSGLPAAPPPVSTALLGAPVKANDHRADHLRATVDGRMRPGALRALTPFPVQDSAMLRRLAHADALILRAPHAPALPEVPRSVLFASIRWACDGDGLRKSAYMLGYSRLSTVSLDDGNGTNIEQL